VAFFGSPAWAVPVAQALHQHHDLVLVVTQPDKPAGRGLQLTPCPVAQWATGQGLQVEKPQKLRKNAEFLELCKSLDLDVAVTAAYGKILPGDLLEVPKYGFLNLHPSDLPKYRGPAPVQWTLINGDSQTAVSLMQTDVGMDTGPVAAKFYSPVDPDETALELSNRLRDEGIELLLEALNDLEHLKLTPQPLEGTHAPLLHKDDGKIIWAHSASDIYNRHRGVQPWPGSWFEYQGKRVKVLKLTPSPGAKRFGRGVGVRVVGAQGLAPSPPGSVIDVAEGVQVSTGEGSIVLLEVQPEGKKPMSASDWARGYQIKPGSLLD
jgi:methionyl-tRNA formyltransferase